MPMKNLAIVLYHTLMRHCELNFKAQNILSSFLFTPEVSIKKIGLHIKFVKYLFEMRYADDVANVEIK